jgi:hypothetical protein
VGEWTGVDPASFGNFAAARGVAPSIDEFLAV